MDAEIILSTVGMTSIINSSYLFSEVRRFLSFNNVLGKFIKCSVCVGFWAGLTLYSLRYGVCFDSFLYGCIGSICSYTYYLLMKYFVDKYD